MATLRSGKSDPSPEPYQDNSVFDREDDPNTNNNINDPNHSINNDHENPYSSFWSSIPSAFTPTAAAQALGSDPSEEPLRLKSYSHAYVSAYRLVVVSFLLSLLICMFNFFGTFSCTNDSFTQCYPQVKLKISDTSSARVVLEGARAGLRVTSYFAKDFSTTLTDGSKLKDKIKYIDTIDTFSSQNEFSFNYHGYCRKNVNTGVESCAYSNGLDVFSSFVKDIGLQLGIVSNSEDPEEVGESLVTAYTSFMLGMGGDKKSKRSELTGLAGLFEALKESSEDKAKNPPPAEAAKEEQDDAHKEGFVKSAKKVKVFGKDTARISTVLMVVSVLLVIVQGNVLLSFTSNSDSILQLDFMKVLLVPIILTFMQVILSLLLVYGELRFFYTLGKGLRKIGVGTKSVGSGFYITFFATAMSIALETTLVLVFYRK